MPEIERTDRAWLGFVGYLEFGIPLTFVICHLSFGFHKARHQGKNGGMSATRLPSIISAM
jgi:hypothetical protein